MDFIKKIIHCLSNIILILVLIYVTMWIPNVFGYKPLVVLSKSMEPTYKEKSIIYYKKVEYEDIKVGDIITFKGNNDELISHRIVDVENKLFITKGDANDVNDIEKVRYEDICGRNININIIYAGYYISFLNAHSFLVIIACVIWIADFLISNYKEKTSEK